VIELHRSAFAAADCDRWRERVDLDDALAAARVSALAAPIV